MEHLTEGIFEDSTSDNATPGEESFVATPKRRKLLCGHCDFTYPKLPITGTDLTSTI